MRISPVPPLILVALSLACMTPPAPPLEPDDFTLAGVPLYADSAEIRLTFGEPDSTVAGDNPFAVDEPLTTWHYPEFEVRLSGDVAVGYLLLGRSESTLRNLRVGDSLAQVRRAYGEPTARTPSQLTYIEQDDDFGLRVVDFVLDDDVVSRIYVGAATF